MADTGNGVTITYKTDAWTAAVESISWSAGGSRESIDTSHLATANYRTFMPGALVDPGEVVCTYQYDGETASLPSITGTASNLVITVSTNTSTNTFTCAAFVTDCGQIEITNDDKMIGEVTLKLTGQYTHT